MENTGFANPADKLVLMMDDDDSVRELLEFVVKKEGFKIEKAADGGLRGKAKKALDKIK